MIIIIWCKTLILLGDFLLKEFYAANNFFCIYKPCEAVKKSMNGTIEVGDNLDLLALLARLRVACLSSIINRESRVKWESERMWKKLPCVNQECKSLTLCFPMRF